MNFKCKITTKCLLSNAVEVVTKALKDYPRGMEWFMSSQFGHLFSAPKHLDICLAPLWMLQCRAVKTKKNFEMWFVVNGIPIRYSLMEHALISGLNCAAYPADYKDIGSQRFKNRNFPKGKKISLRSIRETLEKMSNPHEEDLGSSKRQGGNTSERERQSSTRKKDKLKMAVLYFLCSVLITHEKDDTQIADGLVQIVDDLDRCRTFPWGRRLYHYLLIHFQKLNLAEKSENAFEKKKTTWACPGFILPLMVSLFCLNIKF